MSKISTKWAREQNINEIAAHTRQGRWQELTHGPRVVEKKTAGNAVAAIVSQLENGRHVILLFGAYENDLAS